MKAEDSYSPPPVTPNFLASSEADDDLPDTASDESGAVDPLSDERDDDDEDEDDQEARESAVQEMLEWFGERYEDPVHRTPYESAEGGYIWIWGGPYDATEELESKFGGEYPEEWIQQAVEVLEQDCTEWAPVPSEDDYDRSLFAVVEANSDPIGTLERGLASATALLDTATLLDAGVRQALQRLLFANVITTLETFLSDTFINSILQDPKLIQQLLDSSPEFKKENVPLREVLREAAAIQERVKRYLLDIVWHNVGKVQALYRDVLNVKFGHEIGIVGAAIPTRHDIVHRNGRTKEGQEVSISGADVVRLRDAVLALARDIASQTPSSSPRAEGVATSEDFPF